MNRDNKIKFNIIYSNVILIGNLSEVGAEGATGAEGVNGSTANTGLEYAKL